MPEFISNTGIYKLTNKNNGKIYIGQSKNLKKRYSAYKYNSHHNKILKEDIDEIGFDNFSFEVIEYCVEDKLNQLEKLYIKKFNSNVFETGYNKKNGGFGGGKHCKATIDKMRQSAKNRPPRSKETLKKMSKIFSGKGNPFYGKTHSLETKEKIKNRPYNYGLNNTSARPIYCIETGECFEYASLASKKYSSDLSDIIKSCKNKKGKVKGRDYEYLGY